MEKCLKMTIFLVLAIFLVGKTQAESGVSLSLWDTTVQQYKDYVSQETVQSIIDKPDNIHKTKDALLADINTTKTYIEKNAKMSVEALLADSKTVQSFEARTLNIVKRSLRNLGISNLQVLVLDGKAPPSSIVQPTPQSLSEKTDMKTLLTAGVWNTKDGSDHVDIAKFKKSIESLDTTKLKKMQDGQRETVKTFQTQNTPVSEMKRVFQSTARALIRILLIEQRLTASSS